MTAAAATVARRVFGAAGILMLLALREGLRPSNGQTLNSSRAMSAASGAMPMPAAAATDGASMREWLAANAPLIGLCVVTVASMVSRLRYIASFDGTYGSGDAHGILVRALFIADGNLTPSPQLVMSSEVFDQPALLPAALAAVALIPGVSLQIAPLILMPTLTLAAVVVLYRLLHRTLGLPIAIGASLMFALLPRWSFDSTEPDKAPIVMSFFILALAATEAGTRDRRFLLLSGLLMALSMLAHTTAYLFLPVLAGSYLAWHAGDIKRALNRHAIVALVFPAAAVVIYFVLARVYENPPLDGATVGAAESSVLPGFVQTYVDAARNLTTGGFRDSAWSLYTTGIRNQLGTPVFVLAIGGLALGAHQVVFKRRWQIAPFALWAAFVTLAFAMQYPASSHGGRYPAYVTPVYIVLAAYFVWNMAGLAVVWRPRLIALAGGAAVAALSGYTAITYALAEDPGLRDLYASHNKVADYVANERLLDDGSGMLYLGWPSITFSLLETRPDYEDQLHTFGFGLRPLDQFDAAFIREHDIKYFLLDHTGSDYYDSSEKVYQQLISEFVLQELATFTGRPGSYTSLYLLHPRSNPSQAELSALYADAQSTPNGGVALRNGALCGVADGLLPGWEANGRVELVPAYSSDGCGVRVVNNAEWGGIRQTFPAGVLEGQPFTIFAAFQRPSVDPAAAVQVTVYSGTRLVGYATANLIAGGTNVALEAYASLNGQPLRLVVSTGAGDTGDLIVDRVALQPGRLNEIIARTDAGAEGAE